MTPSIRIKVTLIVISILIGVAVRAAFTQPPAAAAFNRVEWHSDYSYPKVQLERDYSNLAWFGSPQGGVDLPALDRATRAALENAKTRSEERRVGKECRS